jgi:Tol biopolymer transport system component
MCRVVVVPLLLAGLATPLTAGAGLATLGVERVSVGVHGDDALGESGFPALSEDGRLVVFHSTAANLVRGDANGVADVFVRDRLLRTTERISVSTGGGEANGASYFGHVTPDGQYVAFRSDATNLVPGDTNGVSDAFVHDRVTGTTERVSIGAGGSQSDAGVESVFITRNGRFVVFSTRATTLAAGNGGALMRVFVHDRAAGETTLMDLGSAAPNGDSHASSVSADGRYVAFRSWASNLVAGDTNGRTDAFVRDRAAGVTIRLSVSTRGEQADRRSFRPFLSASGQFAVFRSEARNLVGGDTNGQRDVFLRDIWHGVTTRVHVSTTGVQANGRALRPGVSSDGRFVVFASNASNLVPNDTNQACDVFIRDRLLGTTRRVSIGRLGHEADGCSRSPRISDDGRIVAFSSVASNLVVGDANLGRDVFVRDVTPAQVGAAPGRD